MRVIPIRDAQTKKLGFEIQAENEIEENLLKEAEEVDYEIKKKPNGLATSSIEITVK